MDKSDAQARIMRNIDGMADALPVGSPAPAEWARTVEGVTLVMYGLRDHLTPPLYAELLTIGAMAHRQTKLAQNANPQTEAASDPIYIWLHDAPCDGWDVDVPGCDHPEVQERWFQARRDAQMFAAGLSAGRGWQIVDDSTTRSEDEEEEAEQAAEAVDEFLNGARKARGGK